MYETWVTVSGNVSSDVTWRRVGDGTVANFRVMSNERRFDRQTGTWQDGKRIGVRVACWRALADNVRMSVTKGDPVVVHGSLHTSDYEQDGVRRSSLEITAQSVGLDLRKVCTKVVVLQEAEADDGRGLVDVSNLAVVEDDMPAVRYTDLVGPSAGPMSDLEDDETLGEEALAG